MTSAVEQLKAIRATDAFPDDIAAAALRLLGESAFRAQASSDPAGVRAAARQAFAAMSSLAKGAWQRYPAVSGGGFHSGTPDTRSPALYATVSTLRVAGLYLPDDLDRMVDEGAVDEHFAAVESLRFLAFAEVVRALVMALDRGTIDGPRYRQALQEYAKQFGAVRTDGR
jgi:hypothetical protein